MRRPIWQLTGLLSIGLAGCLHGQDWRAAVSKPTIRPVAERRSTLPTPQVTGPFRVHAPKFAPPDPIRSKTLAPSAASSVSQAAPSEATAPPLKMAEPPRTESFAEFERTITPRAINSVNQSPPQAVTSLEANAITRPAPEADVAEVIVPEMIEPKKAVTWPVITPAGVILPSNRGTSESVPPRSSVPDAAEANDPPRALFSKSAALAKELPAVTDATATLAPASPSAEAERLVRPQEVSVLVQQVFDDLRQRRLSDARKRTDWLKQLVKSRTPGSSSHVDTKEFTPETFEHDLAEPRTLIVDPQASPVETSSDDSAPINSESMSHK